MTKRVAIRDLGLMEYKACWDYQESLFDPMVKAKIARRNAGLEPREGELFRRLSKACSDRR